MCIISAMSAIPAICGFKIVVLMGKFDENLKSRNPAWGIRDICDLEKLADQNGMKLMEKVEMPSNNYCLIFKKS